MTNAHDFRDRLAELLRHERTAMADFLIALAEFDRQKLWQELGHASLFSFLRRELGLSAGAAQYRKTAAELVRRFPEVEASLRDGRLCLSSIIELAKVITPENATEILPRFFGLSSRDAALVAASIRPVENPPRREVVTRLPGPTTATTIERDAAPPATADAPMSFAFRAPETPATPAPPPTVAAASRPVVAAPSRTVEPLDGEHARLHMTVSHRFLAKIEAAKDALSHARPGASAEEVLEACMDLLLAHCAKRKGLVERPRNSVGPVRSGAIPAAVRREAWRRAGGCCEWPLDRGGVCGSKLRLEFDHVVPRARGGSSTIQNIRVLCRVHNQLAARRVFGDDWMDLFPRKRSASPVERTGTGEGSCRGCDAVTS